MLKNRGLILQFCKFGAVGICSVLVDYGLMISLVEIVRIDYFIATALSYTFSVFVNYVLSMRYVFPGKEDMSRTKEVTIYFILSFMGLGLNQLLMWIAVDMFGIFYGIAKLMSTFMVGWYNFASRKKFFE